MAETTPGLPIGSTPETGGTTGRGDGESVTAATAPSASHFLIKLLDLSAIGHEAVRCWCMLFDIISSLFLFFLVCLD